MKKAVCAALAFVLGARYWSLTSWSSAAVEAARPAAAPPARKEPKTSRERRASSWPPLALTDPEQRLRVAPLCRAVRAVIVSELADATESMATLRVADGTGFRTCRVGDVLDGARVLLIGSSPSTGEPRVWLERRGTLCQAGLDPLPIQSAHAVSATSASAHGSVREMVGPVRLVPVLRGREIRGLQVLGLRRGSLLSALGIHDGDVIESVDGKSVSPPNVLEAYGRVVTRSSPRVVIGLRRRGARITIQYRFG